MVVRGRWSAVVEVCGGGQHGGRHHGGGGMQWTARRAVVNEEAAVVVCGWYAVRGLCAAVATYIVATTLYSGNIYSSDNLI